MSELEETLAGQMRLRGIGGYVRQYKFAAPERKYQADFAWPHRRLIVEIEGGTWGYGRHNRPQGFEEDCNKYNLAVLQGWDVLRFTSSQVKRQEAVDVIETHLHMNKPKAS